MPDEDNFKSVKPDVFGMNALSRRGNFKMGDRKIVSLR